MEKEILKTTKQPCPLHRVINCSVCLQRCIEEILYRTYAPGNGGYAVDFGPVLFSKMVLLTGYDVSKRRILNGNK